MNFADIDVAEILPQGKDFRMIDSLEFWSLECVRTSLKVCEDNYFVRDGRFIEGGLVENIAQTSAARIGYYHKYVLKTDVRIGFIGAVQNMSIKRLPRVGEVIRTQINVIADALGMTAFDARIEDADGALIAEGRMKTAL